MSMELDHSFTVPVPPDQAWDVLLDVKTIAPCMPGATVDEVDGDVVNGRIKVKVGPVSLTYKGTAKFTERNPDTRVVVVEASGKETRGAGTASATVRAALVPDASGSGTQVSMHTTMNVTGRGPVRPRRHSRGRRQAGRAVRREPGQADRRGHRRHGLSGFRRGRPRRRGRRDQRRRYRCQCRRRRRRRRERAGHDHGCAGRERQRRRGRQHREHGPPAPRARPARSTAAGPVASASAPAQEDSLNLVKLAGPVILKRVVPVAVGAVALAVLSRLLWRLRHRPAPAEKA